LNSFATLLKPVGIWGIIFLALFGLFSYLLANVVSNAATRNDVIRWLAADTASTRYRALLKRGLDALDRRLSRGQAHLPETSAARAWSGGLLSFNLALAFGYPILSLLVAWVISGVGSAGDAVLFPAEPDDMKRYVLGAAICGLASILLVAERKMTGALQSAVQFGALGLFVSSANEFAGAVVVAGVLASGLIFARAGTDGGAGVVAFAIATVVSFTVAGPLGLSFVGAIDVAGVFACAFALAVAFTLIGTWTGKVMLATLVLSLIGTSIIAVAIWVKPSYNIRGDGITIASLVLFISLLPMLNALADFASCGLTRYWMRRGISGNLLWAGVRDTAAGAAIFMALGFASIAAIHVIRPQDGVPLVDLAPIFDALRDPDQRASYGWLAAMLFSTLLPTLVHLMLASLAFFTLAPAGLRHWIVQRLADGGEGHDLSGKLGQGMVVLCLTLAVLIPMMAVWYLFTLRHGVLNAAITVFDWFAISIGAIPAGVPL
jgi:hypothetical protein